MIRFLITLGLLVGIPSIGVSQFNDTIVFKSGFKKPVEISDFSDKKVHYTYQNSKGGTVQTTSIKATVRYFKIYDQEGNLEYSSKKEQEQETSESTHLTDSVSVSKHSLSLNPFLIPFLSANLKHNYTFGKKMQFAITSRFTYLSPLVEYFEPYGNLMVGTGFRLIPVYNDELSFGIDFTPMLGFKLGNSNQPYLLLPINVNIDLFFKNNERVGISFDMGAGNVYQNGTRNYLFRGHFGILWRMRPKKTFKPNY